MLAGGVRGDQELSLLTLGVETSGLTGAIALRRNGHVVEVVSLDQSRRRHAQTLVAETHDLMRRHGLTAKDLELVAVSIGPGSFTGLRMGVVFAKTLAYATGCRLVAVDTLHAIALASPNSVSEVSVVADALRGDVFWGHYSRAEHSPVGDAVNTWHRVREIKLLSIEQFRRHFAANHDTAACFAACGPASELLRSDETLSKRLLALEYPQPQVELVAELGEQLACAGASADPWQLEPFYIRPSAAEEQQLTSRQPST